MLAMARRTQSGIPVGKWVDRLGLMLVRKKRLRGFVFVDSAGKQAKIGSYNGKFHTRLERA